MTKHRLEISVHGGEEGEIAKSEMMRFIVADDTNLVLGKTGLGSCSHKDLIPSDARLVGGGIISVLEKGLDVKWGSSTCKKAFGYDRPADATEAQQVLEAVQEAVRSWLQKNLGE